MKRIAKVMGIILLITAVLMLNAMAEGKIVSSVKLNQVQQKAENLMMYVNMSDANGYPCTGEYRADQFSVSVDGKALDVDKVQAFDPMKQGIHYVFSVDVSKSLTDEMMENVRNSLNSFVDELGVRDTVSLITFGETVTERLVNSADRAAIKQMIGELRANEGMTALYKGVIEGVRMADSSGGRSAVIVITDGKNDPTEEMKPYTKESIYDSVKSAQVPLYCIGLNDRNGVDTESLIELATATGGDQYIIVAEDMLSSLIRTRDIMSSSLVLESTLINTDNKAGFDEVSTFKVGFQPDNGGFVTSNELQQNINWKDVPVPEVSVSPTPIPQLSLELDEDEIEYVAGEMAKITGAIIVEQGVVSGDELFITVNGESWRVSELMRNGNSYTFSASGVVSSTAKTLEVQAEIKDASIASRVQRVSVIQPTAAPTSTPAPILSVELDDNGQDIVLEVGKTISFSGVINVQGVISANDIQLLINGTECSTDVHQINGSQYEFITAYLIDENTPSEFGIQAKLNGTEIYSRGQKVFLVMPTPTPNPELYFSLRAPSVEYVEGSPITIRGNIEVLSGEVDPEDIALYINNVKWDMVLNALSDGTYGFEAENSLSDGSVGQLDVKVRLQSNTKIVSNSEKLIVTTPVPTATPTPTPRPVVTPPPTKASAVQTTLPNATTVVSALPTEDAEPAAVEDKVAGNMSSMMGKGFVGYVAAGIVILVIVVIAVIVISAKRKKNNEDYIAPVTDFGSFSTDRREDLEQNKTVRKGDPSETVRNESGASASSDFVTDESVERANSNANSKSNGTMRIEVDGLGAGTVRLDADDGYSGTVRIEEEVAYVDVNIDEIRGGEVCEKRRLHIECNDELVFGRGDTADIRVNDKTVSGRHLMMTYDGKDLYVVDLASTNGTKHNGEAVQPHTPLKVNSGDSVSVGKTTMKIQFTESRMS